LDVIAANPVEYVERYGSELKQSNHLPDFVLEIPTPEGLVLAANHKYNSLHELEGDVQALKLVDLEKEGLGEYAVYLQKYGSASRASTAAALSNASLSASQSTVRYAPTGASARLSASVASSVSEPQSNNENQTRSLSRVFNRVDNDHSGKITRDELEKVILKLNSDLGRNYGEKDVTAFLNALDRNSDGSISLQEFKSYYNDLL
jgi:hypothetical protein